MPTFNDSEARLPFQPEGDYVWCVIEFGSKISSGGKTAGSDLYEVTLEIEPKGSRCFESLIDHEATAWKIDTFLKSAGVKIAKGEAFDFRKDVVENANAAEANEKKPMKWVNPLGLRGWCHLVVEEYNGKKRNKVAIFYTDKAKLPPRVIAAPATDDAPF